MRLAMALALLSTLACGGRGEGPDMGLTPSPTETEYTLASGTVLTHGGNLRIGTGNIWEEQYVDEQGVSRRGLTAGLWLWLLDGSTPELALRVHVAENVAYVTYRVRVLQVAEAYVRLGISDVP